MKKPLVLFYPDLPLLSKNEMQVLDLLIEAGKLIVPVYLEHEKNILEGPRKEEIERAGKKNPAILSPYTVLEKVKGQIKAVPYHVKYASLLIPVADQLKEAANASRNSDFARCLRIQAQALLDGSYEKATAAWLKMKLYKIDISIGPLEHFDYRLFHNKASYHAWVGVVEEEGTKRFNNYKDTTLSVRRRAIAPKGRVDNFDNVKAKVLDVVLFSGLMAKTKFVGINLPMDINLVEKYGSEVTLFNQPNNLRLKEQVLPVFNSIFTPGFKQGFSKEDLRRGYLRVVALHELAHSYLNYRHAKANLQEFFPCIHELAATVMGIRMAGYLLLQDRINNKQLESMIVAFTSRSFYLKEEGIGNDSMSNYVLVGTIFINFMIESGALKKFKDVYVPNLSKMFVASHDLFNILESLLANGNRKDAETFIKKYSR